MTQENPKSSKKFSKMKSNAKKYFIKGTDEELKFGDIIEADFTKESKGKTIEHHLECKFIPELIDILLENDIIEMRESKPLHFTSKDDIIEELQKAVECLENRIIDLEGTVADLLEDE